MAVLSALNKREQSHKNENYYAPLQYEINYEKKLLPPWEKIIEMCYDTQLGGFGDEIEKVIYSKAKDFRAIILKASTGIYTVACERLCPWDEENEYEMAEYWSGGLPGYWENTGDGMSFYQSMQIAEKEILSMPEFSEYNYCEYLREYIEEGLCVDIQMIANEYIKSSALPDRYIDKEKALNFCCDCKFKMY